jgi:hypothetical protein
MTVAGSRDHKSVDKKGQKWKAKRKHPYMRRDIRAESREQREQRAESRESRAESRVVTA